MLHYLKANRHRDCRPLLICGTVNYRVQNAYTIYLIIIIIIVIVIVIVIFRYCRDDMTSEVHSFAESFVHFLPSLAISCLLFSGMY